MFTADSCLTKGDLMIQTSPKTFRLHIGLFGRRNAGKSSILNAVTSQSISIVSDIAGTTTDPVEKPMELFPLGPVQFIDTAGIDDEGVLGQKRIAKTRSVIDRTDLALLVVSCNKWNEFEEKLLDEIRSRKIPVIAVLNKTDLVPPDPGLIDLLQKKGCVAVPVSTQTGEGIDKLRQTIIESAPDSFVNRPVILADLVGPGECAVLVVPIDKEAPKGRLILPQVQSIRDLLDNQCISIVTGISNLPKVMANPGLRPKLVVTDSQAFKEVAQITPKDIALTSFSILFARFQGDLQTLVNGASEIDNLRPGDRILIAEACSHHPVEDDIGTVKIPRWLTEKIGGHLDFSFTRGHDFPDNPGEYKLVIHCGACMWNRRTMLSRIEKCSRTGVPITNYGLAIAKSLGILERALAPFPQVTITTEPAV
jgi:[FeFe] hydrogenase H-cluster maturation GTPase HydF